MKAKKEITIAIIIGLLIGLIVVGGIIRARSALEKLTPPTTISLNQTSPSPSPTTNPEKQFLNLTTPDNQVVNTNQITIEGNTQPDNYVVILGEKSEYIIVPSNTGGFSQKVDLVKGANTITITSYQTNGTNQQVILNVIYTTAEI